MSPAIGRITNAQANRLMGALDDPDDVLHAELVRFNELLEKNDERITMTYLPVKWWREKVPVPAWVLVGYLVLQIIHTGQAALS
ncbi:MAG: hypothetical protein JWL76_2013 [Thermoleophilia bacterium]|nr:hypothetical protein [Thermoleophilia bacterium]